MKPSTLMFFHRFAKNTKGASVVEFAIVIPFIIALFIVSFNGFDAYRGLRKASTAVHVVSDVASRKPVIREEDRDDLFDAAIAILDRYADSAKVKIIISSVEQDEDGNYVALWSQANEEAAPHEEFLPVDVGNRLPDIPENESVILTEIEFSFSPVFPDLWAGKIVVDQLSIGRPRLIAKIAYEP